MVITVGWARSHVRLIKTTKIFNGVDLFFSLKVFTTLNGFPSSRGLTLERGLEVMFKTSYYFEVFFGR